MFDWITGNDKDTVKIQLDSDIEAVLNDIMKNAGAKDYTEAARYAVLHAALNWQGKPARKKATSETKKRESKEDRTARLLAVLEQLIKRNQSGGRAILMRITGVERSSLGIAEIPVKHWQRAITERVIRDDAKVNQKVAAQFVEDHKAQIEKHNEWLFSDCGWQPTDAHAFNRRTMAAARKFEQLELGE
jgi:hypothetical protein